MSRSHRRTAVLLTGLASATLVTLVGVPAASAALPEITSGDYYRITGGSSPLAIDVQSSSTADDARVVQREVDLESRSQAWRALRQSDGYVFRNANSGKCLSVSGNSKAPGAHLVQRNCDGSAGQLWRARAGEVDPTAGFQSVLSGHYIDVPGNTREADTWLELQPGDADGGNPGASQSFYMVRVDV
jgi:ricin-type beta-trefoil lectin protein